MPTPRPLPSVIQSGANTQSTLASSSINSMHPPIISGGLSLINGSQAGTSASTQPSTMASSHLINAPALNGSIPNTQPAANTHTPMNLAFGLLSDFPSIRIPLNPIPNNVFSPPIRSRGRPQLAAIQKTKKPKQNLIKTLIPYGNF